MNGSAKTCGTGQASVEIAGGAPAPHIHEVFETWSDHVRSGECWTVVVERSTLEG